MTSSVLQMMARQSAALRRDVNEAPVFVESIPVAAGGEGGDPPQGERRMPDNSPMTKLREHLLGLGGEEVIIEIRGKKYLLVAPSEKKAGQIQKAAMKFVPKSDADGKPTGDFDVDMDNVELKVRSLHACLFDPETRQRVFKDDADLEALRDAPVSPVRKRLMEIAVKLINPSLEEVAKNSDATPEGSSSSASPKS